MNIFLYDIEKKDHVDVDLEVEYSIPCSDLFVVFYSLDETCGLLNGNNSRPYNEYFFKKVSHIVSAKIDYEDHKYSLTIGHYIDNNYITPFLIDQRGSNDFIRFETSSIHNDHLYKGFRLINYKEYSELSSMLGFEKLTFKDYLTKLIKDELDKSKTTLYNIFPHEKGDFNDFLTHKGFTVFLDEEEIRTS
ncbi:hypothetical protein GWC95_03655 [Sediminibacterium roseum]|uniref:Uncharacterized protein n=1 Tax=Sediminibacterium roseum TaxID=1978412 RepID=A0ABW9ZTC4_9BACT|nr:hypothetical protein [Sediminibacterium roseum]NCI49002.1 hypothetical protein [Sediminibacterium roseum]